MAASIIQQNGAAQFPANANTFPYTTTSPVTAGSLLVAYVSTTNVVVSGVASGAGSWQQAAQTGNASGNKAQSALFYLPNAPAGSTTLTATFASVTNTGEIYIWEVGGMVTASPLDNQNSLNLGTGTGPYNLSLTTIYPSTVVFAGLTNSNDTVADSGWTTGSGVVTPAGNFVEYAILSTVQTLTATGNYANNAFAGTVASFKIAGVNQLGTDTLAPHASIPTPTVKVTRNSIGLTVGGKVTQIPTAKATHNARTTI